MSNAEQPTTPRQLIDDVVEYLNRFIVFPDPAQADIAALWVIHTHAFDFAAATPYLYVTSAERESGKTRVIEVLSSLAKNTMAAADMTSAAMYRVINDARPTIFIDEVDTIFTGAANESLRNFLNSGYKHGGTVMRWTGKETESFSTFCPKLLAGIDNGAMPDTIESRCVRIVLKRKKPGQEVERWIWRRVEADANALKERIQEWVQENYEALMAAPEPAWIDELGDRQFEIVEPLLQIAERMRGVRERSREAVAKVMRKAETPLTPQAQILKSAQEWFEARGNVDRIPSATLSELTGIDVRRVSNLLRPYDIAPTTIRVQGTPTKCYRKADFTDAWERYL